MNTNPSLEAFENELKKYMDIGETDPGHRARAQHWSHVPE